MIVELLQPGETIEIIRKLRSQEPQGFDFYLKGRINAVCREEKTGEEVWSVDQDNLITDMGNPKFILEGKQDRPPPRPVL